MESNVTLPLTDVEDGEFECDNGSLGSRLACILTYGGSGADMLINYTLVILNTIFCHMTLHASLYKYSSRTSNELEKIRQKRRIAFAHASFVFVVLFQISLCLALGCSGVSIIWCAMCGWILYDRLRRVEGFEGNEIILQRLGQAVILLDFIAIGYYGVMFPVITTVAHAAALVLGAILAFMSTKMTTDFQ